MPKICERAKLKAASNSELHDSMKKLDDFVHSNLFKIYVLSTQAVLESGAIYTQVK